MIVDDANCEWAPFERLPLTRDDIQDDVEPVWNDVARHATAALGDARLARVEALLDLDARLDPFRLDAAEAAPITFAPFGGRNAIAFTMLQPLGT